MNKSRNLVKKIIYKVFGEKAYQKAYVRGKIKDIESGKNLEAEAELIHHFIASSSTVLDIGANYGHYTVALSRLVTIGKVYAFEPVPFTFEVLENVVAHFEIKNATLFHAAVSEQEGSVEMNVPLLDFGAPNTGVAYIGSKAAESNSETVSVKKVRIDTLEIKGRVDFIKIDIEGHEPYAFAGMENLLQTHQPVILIEFSHACLKRAGFVPADFANDLYQRWNYFLARKKGDKLELIDEAHVPDGYYFLIPQPKIDQFKALFHL